MKKRVCAVILALAMIICQMPSVSVRAIAPEGEAQYLEAMETAEETVIAEEDNSESEVLYNDELASDVQTGDPEGAQTDDETEDAQSAETFGDVLNDGTIEDAQSEETSQAAQPDESAETTQPDETAEATKADEATEAAQADGTSEAAQADETPDDASTGGTGENAQINENAQISEDAETELTEDAAETAESEEAGLAGDPMYGGEEDEIEDDDLEVPTNLRWDDITGKWDAVKGADQYKVELFKIQEDGTAKLIGTATPTECEFKFSKIIKSETFTYYFTVKAVSGQDQSMAAKSEEAEFGPVPAPENPRWDGKTARWDAVEGQEAYYVWLYRIIGEDDDSLYVWRGLVSGGDCERDLTDQIDDIGEGKYFFKVRASIDAEDGWYDYYEEFKLATSPAAEFGNPDLIMLPELPSSVMKFAVDDNKHLIASWAAPEGLPDDAGFIYRVTLYKNNTACKTVDVEKGTLQYDFTASGDAPADSEDEFTFGVRLLPAEEETRYCAGLEETMYSWNSITPATDLVRSLEGTWISLIRAGNRKFTFWPVWTGGYGDVSYAMLKLVIKRADGTVLSPLWAKYETGGNLTNSGTGRTYTMPDGTDFEVGDSVEWEATLTNSSYHWTDSIYGESYATCSGTMRIEAAGPHTVTLNANGKGKDSSIAVEDNTYLTQAEGYQDALPAAKGYSLSGFSLLKKGIGEYTMGDRYTNAVTEDLTLYAIWVSELDTVEVNLETPLCGTEVIQQGPYRQVNGPQIMIPMDAKYSTTTHSGNIGSVWYTKEADGSTKTFSGTIKGGQTLYTTVSLTDRYYSGQYLNSSRFTKNLKVTGNFVTGEFKAIYPQQDYTNYVDIVIGMKAEHDWDEWTTVNEATETANGLRRHTCKGCGETEEEVIPRTGGSKITVTTDGNGTAKASVESAKAGTKITLTATPKDGYRFYKWEVVSGGVKISDDTFTIGTEDVKIKATFGKIPGKSSKVTVYNVAQGIKVTWLKVDGATSYYIYRDNLDGKGYKFLFRTSALEVTDLEVRYELGKKFRYKVLATSKYGGDAEGFRTSTYYRLMPTGITSVKNTGAGKMTVTYDKSAGGSGYVVRYGLKKDMSDAKVITVKGANTTSRTFSNLKKGKTYYVQVRTYKIEDGIRYYSGYCLTKTVKIVK